MTLLPTSTMQELQQVQLLMSTATGSASQQVRAVTLSDVASLIQAMQERYGIEASLEEIIQAQVGLQLQAQMQARRARRALREEGVA
ncbi:hypothetical protein KSX_95840 [Ktedonospora formicarum]|uniref:Uncharacterized protein n=2 Tax=Ktedonospora formicarum TaxID=2778364 RepID=A0A8J3ICC2_9CHLR|nr:hypothetical protein KSX_95840 [Ktedonospora formicarum]